MNEMMLDLATAAPWLSRAPHRTPGADAVLWCATHAGGFRFSWQKPPGRPPVKSYRIERTRDGLAYEEIAETEAERFSLPCVLFNDGWFYRVTAFNVRGQGPARWVFFYLRRRLGSILQRVPVRPGLRVGICELIPTR